MTEHERERMPRGARWRTSENGNIRFSRDFTRIGVGRITGSSRTRNPKEFQRRNDILTKLAESGQIEVLRAFRDGLITIEQLVEADREQRLRSAQLLDTLTLQRSLWVEIAETLPRMGGSEQTRKRYEVSLTALRKRGEKWLTERATVADLERVVWRELRDTWDRSAADWNHLRRAISAFLTVLLGDKYHPFRRTVVDRIPIATEVARVPDVTPEIFWGIIKHVAKPYRSCFIALVATGMRIGEFLRCTRFNLKPATFSVAVPGTKTATSAEDVVVHPKLWRHLESAVPSPLAYKALSGHWRAACAKAGVEVRIHDLRHCYAQWAVNAGVPEAKVQTALRHKTAGQTRKYAKTKEKGDAANAVGQVLLRAQSTKQSAQVAAQGGNRGRA
jgi:integrase